VPSIEDEPITAWAIVELTTDGDTWRCVLTQHTRPLTGYGFCTRMTPITMFDPTTMQVFTETGRRYELVGPPDPVILLAEDFWQEYFARDVTAEYWPTEDTR
ncbi:MAG: hypothetical protein Q8P61_02215, partial [Candidatus Nanopelagicales bacterium]|nr:hypothetical protein [Candidatus Nanopelagicales bacterium]